MGREMDPLRQGSLGPTPGAATPPRLWRYAVAIFAPAVALACSLTVQALFSRPSAALFFGAVAISAWYGGLGPGLLSAALSLLAIDYYIIPPRYTFLPGEPADWVTLLILALVAVLISSTNSSLRAARRRAQAAELAERQQREWFSTTLSSIGDAVITTDTNGLVTFLNPVAQALTGWTAAEAAGQPIGKIFRIADEQTRQPIETPIARVLREGAVLGLANHTILLTRGGAELPIDDSAAPIRTPSGQISGVVLVFRDISERHRADQARARLAAIVESSEDAIYSRTMDGLITSWNAGAERLFGYSAAEMLGQPNAILVPTDRPSELPGANNERLRRGEFVAPFETVRRRKDGQVIDVSVSVSPIRNADGELVGASIVARDISDRRALQRAQQEFIAMVGHELRNPLASLKGFAQLMQTRARYDERAIRAIISQTNQLDRLTGDLVDASRLESGRLELQRHPVDLGALASAAVEQAQAETETHHLQLETTPGPLEGDWDPDRIGQVLRNLLSNAIKYSPAGGEIVVRLERLDDQARISIRDHGIGISPEAHAHLFDRFYRAGSGSDTARGLGLGLYITRQLVEAHGGQVWAESEGPGQGSTFYVTLPPGSPLPRTGEREGGTRSGQGEGPPRQQ
jgi:PAS domain S-box-containing protein